MPLEPHSKGRTEAKTTEITKITEKNRALLPRIQVSRHSDFGYFQTMDIWTGDLLPVLKFPIVITFFFA